MKRKCPPQRGAAATAPAELGADRGEVEQVQVLGLGDEATQTGMWQVGGDVEEGPGDGGHRQAAVADGVESAGMVDANAAIGSGPGAGRNVDQCRSLGVKPPPVQGRPVAEDGTRPGVQEAGYQMPVGRDGRVPNCVDAGMDPVQAPFRDPALKCGVADSAGPDLAATEDSPLPGSRSRHPN